METITTLRQTLGITMREYARKMHIGIDIVILSLYERYRVSSRRELSEKQLKESIRYYRDGLLYDEYSPIEKGFQDMVNSYNMREKKSSGSTGMQAVVRLLLDHPSKIWWWSYEVMGKENSHGEWISHRGPARASDLALHHADIVEDRKIGRLAVYRLRIENREGIEKFLLSAQK